MEEPQTSECPTIPRSEHGALRAELMPHLPLDGKWEYYEVFSHESRSQSTGFGEVTCCLSVSLPLTCLMGRSRKWRAGWRTYIRWTRLLCMPDIRVE